MNMGLNYFLSVNLPYGLCQFEEGYWYAFNREHIPLGLSRDIRFKSDSVSDFVINNPYLARYKGLNEKIIQKIAASTDAIQRNNDGTIHTVTLYDDSNNPMLSPSAWNSYQKKLKLLSTLEVVHTNKFYPIR